MAFFRPPACCVLSEPCLKRNFRVQEITFFFGSFLAIISACAMIFMIIIGSTIFMPPAPGKTKLEVETR